MEIAMTAVSVLAILILGVLLYMTARGG